MTVTLYLNKEQETKVQEFIRSKCKQTPELEKYLKPIGVCRDAFEAGLSVLTARLEESAGQMLLAHASDKGKLPEAKKQGRGIGQE